MPLHAMRRAARLRGSPLTIGASASLLLALAIVAAAPATAERTQKGNLQVALGGGVRPRRLPRDRPIPVALRVGGAIRTTDGSPLPRLKRIELTLAGRGLLSTKGLPACPRSRIANASGRQALARCRGALVGRGSLAARLFIPHQASFPIHTTLLAFNGRTANGGPAVWVHAYAGSPPVSIVLPFLIHRQAKTLRTSLIATVPPALRDLPHLAAFQLELFRRYRFHGRNRSYLSASCPAAPGFTEGFLTIAHATYEFADGRRLGIGAVRRCHTR